MSGWGDEGRGGRRCFRSHISAASLLFRRRVDLSGSVRAPAQRKCDPASVIPSPPPDLSTPGWLDRLAPRLRRPRLSGCHDLCPQGWRAAPKRPLLRPFLRPFEPHVVNYTVNRCGRFGCCNHGKTFRDSTPGVRFFYADYYYYYYCFLHEQDLTLLG